MNRMHKILVVLFLLTSCVRLSYGQFGNNLEMTITGPTSVSVGQTTYYSVSWTENGYGVFPPTVANYFWGATGNITTPSSTGASVNWTYAGPGYIYVDIETWDNYYFDIHNVNVTGGVPPAPTTTLATNISASITGYSFNANWTNVSTASSYILEVSNAPTFPSPLIASYSGLTTTTKSLTGLSLNTHYYRVRAVNGSGTSGNSNTWVVPGVPVLNNATNISSNSFAINWNAVQDATSYRVDVSTDPLFGSYVSGYQNISVTALNRNISNLTPATTYYYRVRAVNGTTTSGNQLKAKTAVTLPSPPPPPSNLFVTGPTNTSFIANWNLVSGANSYLLDVSSKHDFSSYLPGLHDYSLTTPSKNVLNLEANKRYYFRVRSVNSGGNSNYSAIGEFIPTLPSFDQNFVRTEAVLVPGVTTIPAVSNLPVEQKTTHYQYMDGLGRNSQSVTVNGSPLKSDLVLPIEYDAYGRQEKEYLPYTNGSTLSGSFKENAVNQQFNYYAEPPAATAGTSIGAYKQNFFEPSPLNRVVDVVSPRDDSWNATPRKVTAYSKINVAGEVPFWKDYTSGVPERSGAHAANTLMVQETINEEGQVSKTYTNLRGQTVMDRIGDGTNWFDTHYIYSIAGLVMFVIQPEGVARLATEYDPANATDKQSFLDRWAFQYQYDDEQRVIAKRVPGVVEGTAGWTYLVYDKWNRLVLSQDPVQWLTNEYSFTKYDRFNRPIITGLYTTATAIATLRSNANAATGRFETEVNNSTGYTLTSSYPTSGISESNLLTVTYYDNYAFKSYTGWDAEGNNFNFVNVAGYPQSSEVFTTVKGQTTGTKVRILGQTRWLNSITHYDNKYRPIQVISENHIGGTIRTTSKVDFVGKIEKEQLYVSQSNLTVQNRFTYDHGGRLLTTHHQVNSQPEVLMVSNKYNEIGQLIDKKVHSADNGNTFLQSVDYRYNIKGWLTNINNTSFTQTWANDDTNDLFGMELQYYVQSPATVGASGNTQLQKSLYDGNISAIKWKTNTKEPGVVPQERVYVYDYDILSRLKKAHYAKNNGTWFSPAWTGDSGMYDEEVKGYDKNGNIKAVDDSGNPLVALERFGKVEGAKTAIDQIKYGYALNGKHSNRLIDLNDTGTSSIGFKPAASSVTEEFLYDNNGRMKFDHNKSISSILYNHLNLPREIQFTRPGGQIDKIEYTYDAVGNKLKKIVRINNSNPPTWTTDYVGGIQYDNGTLSFFATEEGRMTNNNGTYEYEYFHRDHQGNVRLVYGPLKETLTYRATMENPVGNVAYAQKEEADFVNIANRRHLDPVFNYTKSSEQVVVPNKSARLNGFSGTAIGPAKKLRVLTGDKVYMETHARYNQVTGSNATVTAATLLSAVTGTFGILPTGETATLYQSMSGNLPAVSGSMTASTVVPKAYLVWLFFDDNKAFVRAGALAITTTAYNAFEKLGRSFTAEKNGDLYVYVANETNVNANVNVYFDDTYIIHEKNNITLQVTQASDYYPFGLSFNEYQSDRLEQTSSGVYEPQMRNRYLFQGQEKQSDLDLGWYQFKWRMHDPAIGRFGAVDPLAEKYMNNGTYVFSENRLINGIELEGLEYVPTGGVSAFLGLTKALANFNSGGDPKFGDYIKAGAQVLFGYSDMGQGLQNIREGTQRKVANKVEYMTEGGNKIQHKIENGENPQDVIQDYHEENTSANTQIATGYAQVAISSASIQLSLYSGGLASAGTSGNIFSLGYSTSERTIIGEGMKRVSFEAAKRPGSITLSNMPKFTGARYQVASQMMTYNRKWFLQQMRSGRPVLNLGLDPARVGDPSIFFQMEQNMMRNYLRLHPNAFQVLYK